MTPKQLKRIEELFAAAADLPVADRTAYLEDRCRDDADVRKEVESLLAHDANEAFLEQQCEDAGIRVPEALEAFGLSERALTDDASTGEDHAAEAIEVGATNTGIAGIPKRVGQYRITRAIASGGMGTVYEAEQDSPRRTVALKVIRHGLATPASLKRFELESQVLGRLQHPGIAQIYEAGTADAESGKRPYFAMEYICGVDLRQYVKQKKLGNRERLELIARICDAVHHAHQKGVIHRDLKPGNILVDQTGQPKILDFGVARATDSDMQVTTLQTDVGQLIGTLQYMSPEQVAADPNDLDTRSDVYALGVIAYEMLTGQVPYDLKNKMIHEAARIIREDEPTSLSSASGVFRGDIETIVVKAMEKDKERRYQSAAELAGDIRRFLHDEPILAHRQSAIYQLRKFAKRNKAIATGLAVATTALLIGMATSTYLYLEADSARQGETQQRKLAERREADAVAARAETQARADELKTVTEFQQSMLADIDAETMGREIVAAQREGIRAGMENDGADSVRVEAALTSFDTLADSMNATNLALTVVDENVLARAVDSIEKQFADQPVTRAALQQTLADTYREIGLRKKAMPLQKECLQTRRWELGDDHPDTLESIAAMGVLLRLMGNNAEAEPFYREALEGKRRVLGNDHPDTLSAINGMGWLLHSMGKYAEAEPYYREALEGLRRVLGNDHPDTLGSINNMGFLLKTMGKYAEAEPFYRESLAGKRRVLGDDNPKTFTSITNMGMLLLAMGKPTEAEPYFREALAGRRRVLGDDHPGTLIAIGNMGGHLRSSGRLEEALVLSEEAVRRTKAVLPEGHLHTGIFQGGLGKVYQKLGRFQEAETNLLESRAILDAALGAKHARTISTVRQLIDLYEAWHTAEPGNGYDAEATEWRATMPKDQTTAGK